MYYRGQGRKAGQEGIEFEEEDCQRGQTPAREKEKVCECVCVREREREKEKEKERERK